jgi:hypothetical protein
MVAAEAAARNKVEGDGDGCLLGRRQNKLNREPFGQMKEQAGAPLPNTGVSDPGYSGSQTPGSATPATSHDPGYIWPTI